MRRSLLACLLPLAPLCAQNPKPTAGVDRADLAARYARVEEELRAAPTDGLDAAQRQARARLLDCLHAYRLGELNRNVAFPGERVPMFIDDRGQRCAVAFLLDHSGQAALTQRIAAADNHVWVVELLAMPELQQWLQQVGLSAEEAVRIQAPGFGGRSQSRPVVEPPPPPPEGSGSDDAAPRRRSASGSAPPSRPTPGRPAPAAGAAARAPTVAAGGIALDALEAEGWRTWWEWNRTAVLDPAPAVGAVPAATTTSSRPAFDAAPLRPLLRADQAPIRAEAAFALAALAGAGAADDLLPLLGDAAAEVRAAAVLGLGHAGAAGRHALLRLAAGETTADAQSRLLAVLALVLARGIAERAIGDDVVAALLRDDSAPETLQTAALAYAGATGAAALRPAALALLQSGSSPVLRSRAAEALGPRLEVASFGVLQDALSGRSLELRRAAANALARSHHRLALPPLLTAYELEQELHTRALLLVAIGGHGGGRGRAFLREQLRSGPKALRAWAALGLSLQVRGVADAEGAALLERFVGECSELDALGAGVLALGLSHTPNAVELLQPHLLRGANTTRGAAVDALGALGDPRGQLPAVLAGDSCPWVRSLAAEALGRLGSGEDALRAAFASDADASVQAAAAAALGRQGRGASLMATAQDAAAPTARRVAALRGLWHGTAAAGALLRTAALQSQSLYPDWLAWALRRDR